MDSTGQRMSKTKQAMHGELHSTLEDSSMRIVLLHYVESSFNWAKSQNGCEVLVVMQRRLHHRITIHSRRLGPPRDVPPSFCHALVFPGAPVILILEQSTHIQSFDPHIDIVLMGSWLGAPMPSDAT